MIPLKLEEREGNARANARAWKGQMESQEEALDSLESSSLEGAPSGGGRGLRDGDTGELGGHTPPRPSWRGDSADHLVPRIHGPWPSQHVGHLDAIAK